MTLSANLLLLAGLASIVYGLFELRTWVGFVSLGVALIALAVLLRWPKQEGGKNAD